MQLSTKFLKKLIKEELESFLSEEEETEEDAVEEESTEGGFYLLYVWYWLVGVWKLRSFHGAYMYIPFEKEAYANDQDPTYPINRKAFSWRKYDGI